MPIFSVLHRNKPTPRICNIVFQHHIVCELLIIVLRITGFWTLSIFRYSRNQKIQRFGNWIRFRSQVRGETPTLFGPLERVFRIPDDGQIPKAQ
jgi:hypothetical protein